MVQVEGKLVEIKVQSRNDSDLDYAQCIAVKKDLSRDCCIWECARRLCTSC